MITLPTSMNRRSFISSTIGASLGAAALAVSAKKSNAQAHPSRPKKRIKLGLATYSYWHFRDPKVSIETVIDKAGEMGVEGLDVLHRQMDIPEKEPITADHRAYLQKLKRRAFRNGVATVCLSTHQTFL